MIQIRVEHQSNRPAKTRQRNTTAKTIPPLNLVRNHRPTRVGRKPLKQDNTMSEKPLQKYMADGIATQTDEQKPNGRCTSPSRENR